MWFATKPRLRAAASTITDLARTAAGLPDDAINACEVRNLARVSQAIVQAASAREESRGAHSRADFPDTSDALRGRFVLCGGREPVFVPLPVLARDAP